MGLGNFKVRWADKLELALGAALELVGILPRDVCRWCSTRLGGGDSYCRVCGTRRGQRGEGRDA